MFRMQELTVDPLLRQTLMALTLVRPNIIKSASGPYKKLGLCTPKFVSRVENFRNFILFGALKLRLFNLS